MNPADNTKIYEGELAIFWFDEIGILCARAKDTPRTMEKQRENYNLIRQITSNKKVCILSDTTNSTVPSSEKLNYIECEQSNYFKAMAVISKSAKGEIFTKLFFKLNSPNIPMEFFTEEKEAKEWLKQYL